MAWYLVLHLSVKNDSKHKSTKHKFKDLERLFDVTLLSDPCHLLPEKLSNSRQRCKSVLIIRLGRRLFLKESVATGLLLSLPWRQTEAAPPPNHLYWVKNIPNQPFTSPSHPNDHAGVNALLELMGQNYRKFYLSAVDGPLSGRYGLIAADDALRPLGVASIERAFATSRANTSAWKPGGSFRRSSAMSARTVHGHTSKTTNIP